MFYTDTTEPKPLWQCVKPATNAAAFIVLWSRQNDPWHLLDLSSCLVTVFSCPSHASRETNLHLITIWTGIRKTACPAKYAKEGRSCMKRTKNPRYANNSKKPNQALLSQIDTFVCRLDTSIAFRSLDLFRPIYHLFVWTMSQANLCALGFLHDNLC